MKEKVEKQRTIQQNKSIHKGCTDIANLLTEQGKNLSVVIERLDVRPSMESVKDIFRAIAKAKYGIESTSDLKSNQVMEVWDDLIKAISETTGIFISFPSQESFINYE